MEGWHKERLKWEGFGRSILKICIIQALKIQRGNYFGREPTGRAEVEAKFWKIKIGKAEGNDEIAGEITKGGGDGGGTLEMEAMQYGL